MSYGRGIPSTQPNTWGYGGIVNSDAFKTALAYTTSNLRDGKGAIYVKSSGNDWDYYDGSEYVYCGPSKGPDARSDNMPCGDTALDPRSSLPYFIITGALNANDTRSSYSTPGAALWVAGFGGEYGQNDPAIMTTDQSTCAQGYVRTCLLYTSPSPRDS